METTLNTGIFIYGFLGLLGAISGQIILGQLIKLFSGKIKGEMALIVIIFCGSPFVAYFFSQFVAGTILFLALNLAYIVGINPAKAAQSPSFIILDTIESYEKRGGAEKGQIIESLTKSGLLEFKINELLNDGWIEIKGEKVQLRGGGFWMARIYSFYNRLMGLKIGG